MPARLRPAELKGVDFRPGKMARQKVMDGVKDSHRAIDQANTSASIGGSLEFGKSTLRSHMLRSVQGCEDVWESSLGRVDVPRQPGQEVRADGVVSSGLGHTSAD